MRRLLALPLLVLAAPALAGPPATLDDVAWLTGSWTGHGIGGAPAGETYSAPAGGQMAGHFYQLTPEGEVMFYELITIVPDGAGSLRLRLKHFGADLAGWETQGADQALDWELDAIAPGMAKFGAVTFLSEGEGEDGLKITVAMEVGGELAFELTRQ